MSFARTGQNQPSSNTVSRREARRRIERSEAAANLLTSVGMTVQVWKDDGTRVETVTTSAPWRLGHGQWVVKLEGFSGGYACERVSPLGSEAAP